MKSLAIYIENILFEEFKNPIRYKLDANQL